MKFEELTSSLYGNDGLLKFQLKKGIDCIYINRDIGEINEIYIGKGDNFEEIYIYSVLNDLKIDDDKELKKRINKIMIPGNEDKELKNILLSYIR